MNHEFYQYYNNPDTNEHTFAFPSQQTNVNINHRTKSHKTTSNHANHVNRSQSAQQIHHKTHKKLNPNSTLTIPKQHSKSTGHGADCDKPRLRDISSQESDTPMSSEFKKWSSKHKTHALRKAKSPLIESHHSNSHHPYDNNPPPQYTPNVHKAAAVAASSSISLNAASAAAASRHATSSYPYPNGAKARQYYGNINNYIVDSHKRPRGHGSHGYYQHSRDRSQQSQQSGHSFASTTMSESAVTATTQLSNNNVSSTGSSEDLQKEHMMKQYVYTDYASPSPTLVTKTWQVPPQPPQPRTSRSRSQPGGIGVGVGGGYVLNNQSSNSTNASVGSMNFKQGTPVQGIGAMFYEIARHFESCIQYLIHHIPRQYIYAMNEDMVKFTLEFCGFDVENGKKFDPLFVQLQQHLKMQNINTASSKINVFAYSGDKLLQYLRQCQDLLCSYINSPRNLSHSMMRDNLLSVFYSYYVKHGLSSMSVYALHSFYDISHQYRLTQEQLKKMNEKLAVVKNLFTDDLKHLEPAAPSALSTDYKPVQQSMAPQISAPVNHHQLQAKPINHSKSHPELAAHIQNNKIIERRSDDIDEDLQSDEFKMEDGGESTPVLSDINDIDRHLSSQNGLAPGLGLNEYDSDMQSEMSATPQPADIQNAIIQQFIPNAITLNSSAIPNMSIQAIKEEPKLNAIQCEISNDADDEVSSPGSMSTSTDNDTVGGSGIKTLTPTPHKPNNISTQRSSQIIIPSPVEHLRSIKVHNMTPTVKKVRKKANKRQSWTDIAMEKIEVYVNHDANNREFKMMQPINQQQGVQNMIKEYRKSLGQNELKDTLEVLRKEFDGDEDEDEDEEEEEEEEDDIIDVNEQSDDEFFDDEELRAAQAKYMSFNGQSIASKPKLNTMDSNDTTSSRQVLKENSSKNAYQISNDYTKKIIHEESRNRRGSSNKSNSNHSKHSQHSSHRSHRSNQSNSKHSHHSNHQRDRDRDRDGRKTNKLESQYGILSNSTTRSNKRNRRSSDSETGLIRKFTNDTTPSTHRPMQPNHYQYSNNSVQSKHSHRQHTDRRLEMKYYHSNSSHSRSSSDFIGSHNLSYKPPPNGNANNQRYNYQIGAVYDVEEQSDNNSTHSSARKYQKKNENENESPKANGSRKKLRRVITAKHEQIRSNYMVRAQYVDQHQSFSKYASDRNKSWKKWIKLLQSHDSDITNVSSLAQVQALIDFARMSLGNFGNWLMMKSVNNGWTSSFKLSANWNKSKVKAKQWTRYFAIMRDFNLFLFADKYIPSTLDDVVNAEYLALSVAHIENVRQCTKNECELYLEVTGSKSNHKLKFRCESTEACQQWVAEMNYQIHIVSDLCCNQSLRLECADQKRSIWIPVAPLSKVNPYSINQN